MLRKPEIPIFLLGMCSLLNLYSTQPILTDLARWSGHTPGVAAWTISATTLGVALCAPLSGALSDAYARKRVMLIALAILTLTTLACSTAPHFTILLTLRFLQGLATPFIFTVAVAYISEEFTHTARINSLYVAGTAFGGFAGRLFAGLLTDATGSWRLSFWANAAIIALTFLTVAYVLPTETHFHPTPSTMTSLRGLGSHLTNTPILASCFIAAALLFQQVSSFTFGSLYLAGAPFHLPATTVSAIFVVFLLPTILTPLGSRLISSQGHATTFRLVTTITLIGMAISLIPTIPTMVICLACSCVAVFLGQSCGTSFVATHAHHHTSAAVGLYTFSYYLGGALGSLIPQPAYTTWGWTSTVTIITILTLTSLTIAHRYWTHPTPTTPDTTPENRDHRL